MPKVSVLMPVYNAEKYIKEAIDSILNQTFTDFEFIIIDDGSSDNSVNIIKSYADSRIRFYQNEYNIGVAATLNRGLDLVTGKYIARMDSDDISLPERLKKQVSYMDENPSIVVLGSGIRLFGVYSAERIFSEDYEHLKIDLLFGNCFAHPAVIMRAACFGKENLRYDNQFDKMEDFDLWVRTAEQYEIASLPEVLLQYRIHPSQVTQKKSPEYKEQLHKLKQRQIQKLGIEPFGQMFEQYVQYCLGEFDATEQNIMLLSNFLALIKKKNVNNAYYKNDLLKEYFDAVITGKLSVFSIYQAMSIAGRCQINGAKYGIQRIVRSAITTAGGVIQEKKQRSKLKSKDFSIISNNCWGSFIYQKYGIKYRSPTVGLYILGHDFVKLCSNLEWYIEQRLAFIPWEDASYYYAIKDDTPYPVAKLGDIEIYFMHYHSDEEAAEKWYRRVKRINPEKIIFKLSQREECTGKDIQKFMQLPVKNKVCFSYEQIPGVIYVPELEGFVGDEQLIVEKYFDEVKLINSL